MKFTRLPFSVRPMSRDKADTLLLLFSCSLVLALHVAHLPLWIPLLSMTLLVWRAWITFHGNRMPSNWLLVPLAFIAMALVLSVYKTIFNRDAGVAMLVLLVSFKLLEMRAKQDLFSVVFVSFFLILSHFFYSQSIFTATMTLIAVIALLTTQLSFQYTGLVPPLKQRLGLGLRILALALPLTLLLFFLFPRVKGPLWGVAQVQSMSQTGLSETMSPGNISNLAQSDDVAFRVKFIDPPPPKSKLYWRGIVLGTFDGRTWLPPQQRPNTDHNITLRTRSAALRHEVTLEPNGRRWLFALELPQAVPELANNPAGFSPDLQLLASNEITERVRYDVASFVDFDLQVNAPKEGLRHWLQLPREFNPNTQRFADDLRTQFQDDTALINATLQFFHNEKFSYTLQPPLLGQHTVDEFLFSTRAGFCEHYASSFVVLMRAAGIPARVITGYQGGEINPVDGFMSVRQSDAHAWAEVWLENRGWVRIDPTAAVSPDRIEKNLNAVIPRPILGGLMQLNIGENDLLSRARISWEAINNVWNQQVLNYTSEKQKKLLNSLGFQDADWRTLIGLLFALGSIVMAMIVYPLIKHRQKIDPLKRLYLSLCALMAQHGLPREQHEGPRSYAHRLSAYNSPLTSDKKIAVSQFLLLYESLQYGSVRDKSFSTQLHQLKSLLSQCR